MELQRKLSTTTIRAITGPRRPQDGPTNGRRFHTTQKNIFFSRRYAIFPADMRIGITHFGVFTDTFTGHKMRLHLLKAPDMLVIWAVTHPRTNRALRCFVDQIATAMSNVARKHSYNSQFSILSHSARETTFINVLKMSELLWDTVRLGK
jgi:hypothetical protein